MGCIGRGNRLCSRSTFWFFYGISLTITNHIHTPENMPIRLFPEFVHLFHEKGLADKHIVLIYRSLDVNSKRLIVTAGYR